MKQKDLALILVIVFISAIISYFVSNMFFASPKNRQQQVEVVEPISANFSEPDTKYFNNEAINPTQLIRIEQSTNTDPFRGSGQ
jgi:hypothetical protein